MPQTDQTDRSGAIRACAARSDDERQSAVGRRSELLSVTMKTIQQRQAPLSGSPAKRMSEKKLQFHHFLRLCTFALAPGAFHFSLI